jgi:hypothetical protein
VLSEYLVKQAQSHKSMWSAHYLPCVCLHNGTPCLVLHVQVGKEALDLREAMRSLKESAAGIAVRAQVGVRGAGIKSLEWID